MNIHQIYILTALMFWGCHGNPKSSSSDNSGQSTVDTLKHSHSDLKPLDKGIVIDSVHCSDVPDQVYAVYLPSNYSTAKKWPIIYFFDPHGVGNLPLNLYKDLAEKYGYIIAGTYG